MINLFIFYATIIGLSMGQSLKFTVPKDYPLERGFEQPNEQPIDVADRAARLDGNCVVVRPNNPDCCFMIDRDHDRTQGAEPLHTSPYLINLVSVGKKQLNMFEKVKRPRDDLVNGTVIWKLTPLKKDPQNRKQQIKGGPIRMQIYTTGRCFDQFWVQAKKLIGLPSTTVLSGSFEEIPDLAEYPSYTKQNGERKVGCDNDPSNNNTEATIVSASSIALNSKCQREVDLAWNPPQKCTKDQITSGDTMKCRSKDDLYFFTFTLGNTANHKFWAGQNSFGFYVDHAYD